jgi:hypothetical protein
MKIEDEIDLYVTGKVLRGEVLDKEETQWWNQYLAH